jgi:hypothetical protein
MSRWAEAFAALSGAPDTFDTLRHSEAAPAIVSQSVQSVTVAPAAADRALAKWGEADRAAIVEYDGKIPREWAEGFAWLDPDRVLGDVAPRRWQQFVDDVGRFLDGPFCAAAAALAWGPHDLFGCDRDRPFARIDRAGLLWLLNGDRLIALSENTATIETRTGARQTWRRKPVEPDRVLAWELSPESCCHARPGCRACRRARRRRGHRRRYQTDGQSVRCLPAADEHPRCRPAHGPRVHRGNR